MQEIGDVETVESMEEYYRVMKLEWVLLMVLSVQILHHLFVEEHAPCFGKDFNQ